MRCISVCARSSLDTRMQALQRGITSDERAGVCALDTWCRALALTSVAVVRALEGPTLRDRHVRRHDARGARQAERAQEEGEGGEQ